MEETGIRRMAGHVWGMIDHLTQAIIQANHESMGVRSEARKQGTTRLLTAEEDVKHLLTRAATIEDIWDFFRRRLNASTSVDLMMFSVLEERGDLLSVRFMHPHPMPGNDPVMLSMSDSGNHLIRACKRQDTTFTSRVADLGEDLMGVINPPEQLPLNQLNLFSIP